MDFIKDLIKLIKTKEDYFELKDLERILGTEDERYLLDFSKEIKELDIGYYNPSDCTVESLKLNRMKLNRFILSKIPAIKDFIK